MIRPIPRGAAKRCVMMRFNELPARDNSQTMSSRHSPAGSYAGAM